MPELEIDVAGFDRGVGPDDRVVAHPDVRGRTVGILIHTRQDVDIFSVPWILVVGVPLIVRNREDWVNSFEQRVFRALNVHSPVGERLDVASEAYPAHKIREPFPHRIAVELSQKGGVMEADVATETFFNIFNESLLRSLRPGVWRKVELDDSVEVLKELRVHIVHIVDDGHSESAGSGDAVQPRHCHICERFVVSAVLADNQNVGFGAWGSGTQQRQSRDH